MIKKVVHLADIHIRTLRMHDEYKDVFKTLLKDLRELLVDYSRDFTLSYQAARIELFRDYDTMDMDPIISSALDISIDGIGPHFDYIRYGETWSTVEKNLDRYQELEQALNEWMNPSNADADVEETEEEEAPVTKTTTKAPAAKTTTKTDKVTDVAAAFNDLFNS